MAGRDLPALPIFADEMVAALGAELVRGRTVLDEGEYPSTAIALTSGHHAILLRDHKYTISISLPRAESRGRWDAATRAEWQVTPQMRETIAKYAHAHPNAVSMADVIASLKPELEKLGGSPWVVDFPGTPVPSEAWLRSEERSVGLFQQKDEVMLVVWAQGMESKQIRSRARLAELGAWVAPRLEQQRAAQEAARVEKARLDALPKPQLEDVKARLRAGETFSFGGRYSESYSWDGTKIVVDICDEGLYDKQDVSDEKLAQAIEYYPDVFRIGA